MGLSICYIFVYNKKETVLSMDCMSDFENRYTEQIVEILRVVPVAYDATGDKLIREISYVVPEGE